MMSDPRVIADMAEKSQWAGPMAGYPQGVDKEYPLAPIDSSVNQLRNELFELDGNINLLESRISPILGPEVPSVGNVPVNVLRGGGSPHANTLNELRDFVSGMRTRVATITGRLEI